MTSGGPWFGDALFSGRVQFRSVTVVSDQPSYQRFSGARARLDDIDPLERGARTWPPGIAVVEPEDPRERVIEGRPGEWGWLRQS